MLFSSLAACHRGPAAPEPGPVSAASLAARMDAHESLAGFMSGPTLITGPIDVAVVGDIGSLVLFPRSPKGRRVACHLAYKVRLAPGEDVTLSATNGHRRGRELDYDRCELIGPAAAVSTHAPAKAAPPSP